MYLSDRDLRWAIECGNLIVDPKPSKIDPTSIDVHLDAVDQAKVWDLEKYNADMVPNGHEPNRLRIAKFEYKKFAPKYLTNPPVLTSPPSGPTPSVYRCGHQIVIRPFGFLLWQTKETVGTPDEGANLICFVDGKSTRARTGILVHLTAPTIHASWSGRITLEISNLGPFDFVLEEGDAIAQIVVATISSVPAENMKFGSVTYRQKQVTGASE